MDEAEAIDEGADMDTDGTMSHSDVQDDTGPDAGVPETTGSDGTASRTSASDDADSTGDAATVPDAPEPLGDEEILKAVEQELTDELEAARSHEPLDPDVELQALRGELEVLQDRYLRTRAEYDNFRKRTGQELQTVWGRAQADMVESFLEALDDLQRVGTWDQSTTDLKALIEGVDLVERKFNQALGRAGVEAMDPLGEVFDPNTMEAMMKVPTEDASQEDRVAEVFQKGYLLKGTLVRAARVGVYTSD